jgi:hypothetical protein
MQWNSLFVPARLLLTLTLCLIALEIEAVPKALPDAVVHAHTIFLVNDTGFNELQYSTIFELNKWGRFDLVDSAEKADLILRLDSGNHVRAVPDGQFPSTTAAPAKDDSEIPRGHTRISLLDPKNSALLWSDTHKTEGGKVKNGHLLDGLREAFDAYEKSRR